MAGHITVELDQPRQLILTMESVRQLDRSYGEVGLITINNKLRAFNIDALERVLWASMLDAEPTLTLSQAKKRVAEYHQREKLLAPLFLKATEIVEASGLFKLTNEDEEVVGNEKTATAPAT